MNRHFRFDSVRLLVDDNGRKVWRTFKAAWLVGVGFPDGSLVMGQPAQDLRQRDKFSVLLGPSGRIAVYRQASGQKAGTLETFDSLAAAKGHIPDDILGEAEITAGVRKRDDYPEEPWEL
jgi:hypothetical protein